MTEHYPEDFMDEQRCKRCNTKFYTLFPIDEVKYCQQCASERSQEIGKAIREGQERSALDWLGRALESAK